MDIEVNEKYSVKVTPELIEAVAKKVIDLTNSITTKTYTVNQAAKYLNLTPQTVTKHIRMGLLNASRPGKSWIITKSDLDAYRST